MWKQKGLISNTSLTSFGTIHRLRWAGHSGDKTALVYCSHVEIYTNIEKFKSSRTQLFPFMQKSGDHQGGCEC